MSNHAPTSYASHHETQTFNELLAEQLRSTPWVVASLAIHVVIAIVLSFMSTTERVKDELIAINATADVEPEKIDPEKEEPEPTPEEITPDETPVETPAVVDFNDDPVERDMQIDDDSDAKGETDDDSLIDTNNTNEMVIGIGSGPGAFGRGTGGDRNRGRRGSGWRVSRSRSSAAWSGCPSTSLPTDVGTPTGSCPAETRTRGRCATARAARCTTSESPASLSSRTWAPATRIAKVSTR